MSDSDTEVIRRLEEFLRSKKFKVQQRYTVDGICIFLNVFSEETGDDLIVSIPSEYAMPVSDGIELVLFSDIDPEGDYTKMINKGPYQEMRINGLEDDGLYLDPSEVDRLMEQYQAIDIDSEKAETLKSNMCHFKKQLDRLKTCTNNIKYKLCILSDCCLCTITRLNTIECYAVKGCIPSEKLSKDLLISIDLESFHNKMETVHLDITKVYKNLYMVLNKAHDRQSSVIDSRLRQYIGVQESIKKTYAKKIKFEEAIETMEKDLRSLKLQELVLIKKIDNVRNQNDTHMSKTANKSFNLDHLNNEYTKLLELKDETVVWLSKMKKDFNDFLLVFDQVTFDNIILFSKASDNFIKIKVLPELKKYN